MKKNLGINAILNAIKSSLSILFPLITYPYALRVLGAESIGKVSYSLSIVSYFSLFAMLGVSIYGVREGAKRRSDKEALNSFVNELFTINVGSTIISYLSLGILLVFVKNLHPYSKLILLQSVSIMLTTFGLEWVNTVYEDFYIITIRSIITHVLSMVLLFVLVKTPNDYYIYAFLSVLGNGIVCVSNWFYLKKELRIRLTLNLNLKEHIKPLLLMFSNIITISIYVNFDMTMLGWFKGAVAVGLYAIAVKIYNTVKNILVAVYTVAIPRLASFAGENNYIEYKKLYTDFFNFLTVIILPSTVGLICLSNEILFIMGGQEYIHATLTLKLLAIALTFAIFGGLVTAVLNNTIGREKDNVIAAIYAAVINFGLNLICIPLFTYNGAAFTTLVSEAFVFFFCLFRIKDLGKYLDKRLVLGNLLDSILGCVTIVGTSALLKLIFDTWYMRFFLIGIIGSCSYFIVLIVRKNMSALKIKDNIVLRLKKRRDV